MSNFIRITNGIATEHYITRIEGGNVYYGHIVPGHENKQPTAVMAVSYYNRLREREQHGTIYIDGCTYGRSVPCTTSIVGEVI